VLFRSIPVAAPALLARTPIRVSGDLARHTLLHTQTRDGDWPAWLARAGAEGLQPARELHFEHLQFALQAALDGLGVALGPHALVAQDLADGRLVAPLARPRLPLDPYCCALPPDAGAAGLAFAAWLEGKRP
jgi:LysR family glycine cleavage system transcriptional activator